MNRKNIGQCGMAAVLMLSGWLTAGLLADSRVNDGDDGCTYRRASFTSDSGVPFKIDGTNVTATAAQLSYVVAHFSGRATNTVIACSVAVTYTTNQFVMAGGTTSTVAYVSAVTPTYTTNTVISISP